MFARLLSRSSGAVGGSGSIPIETHRPHKRFSTPVVSLSVCMLSGAWRKPEIMYSSWRKKSRSQFTGECNPENVSPSPSYYPHLPLDSS